MIDSGTYVPPDAPPLPETENRRGGTERASLNEDERKQEIALVLSAPPSAGVLRAIFNPMISFFGNAAKQTASALSSFIGFFGDLFTDKSSVPERIIPIKPSQNETAQNPQPENTTPPNLPLSGEEKDIAAPSKIKTRADNSSFQTSDDGLVSFDAADGFALVTVKPDITRREVLDLIKQYDDNSKALIYAANAITGENSLTISQSISGLEKKISNLQYINSRQLDKPASIVSRTDADIKNISGASIAGSTITSSSFSGTTGTFTGNLSGTTGSFSGLLTLSANLLMPASSYLNFGATEGSSGYGLRDNGGTIQFKNSGGSWTAISPASYWGNNGASIYYNDGNVGIGTTSPYAKLSVVGQTVAEYFTATSTMASTFPYASTTAFTISGNSYLGTVSSGAWNGTAVSSQYGGTGINSSALTGIAQIVAGTWSASSTLSTAFGGTGWGNLQANTVLLGNGAGRIATTSAGTDGYVLALSAGVPTWLATSTLSSITGTLAVGKGGTGQTSFGQGWLNSDGTTLSASTSPTVNYIVATSTTATSTFPYLSVTTNSNLGTVVGGTWQGTVIGDAYLTKSGDWTGTLDTYNGSDLLARANHTGTQGVSTLSNYDWTFANNYGAINLTASSTKPLWAQGGLNASSTSNFVYASTTAFTISGNSYLGTVSSGAWNGTAITDPYISSAIAWNNKWDLASSTIPVSKGGTGQTSGYNNTNWDTAYTNRITSAAYPLSISSNTLSLAFGTTTSNTWAGTQTFTNAISGSITGNAGTVTNGVYTTDTRTVTNTMLANSTISGVSLGGTLANLTATDGSLTFSGTYTGAAAQTIGLNLGNANTWTALQTFANATSTLFSSAYASSTSAYFGTAYLPSLGTPAGTFLAVNGAGQVIATTTPGSSSQWTTNGSNIYYTAGAVGIGTTTPAAKLHTLATTEQLRLGFSNTAFSSFTVDTNGNLTMNTTGNTITIPDQNLKVCSVGACQTTVLNSGNGNLTVENNIEIGGNYNRTCATGYIWVPGSAKFGTLPGFCVMKYEAKNDGSNNAVSTPTGGPWVSIDQPTSRTKCEAIGLGYHLISEPEWMTIAENIAQTPINDMDDDAGLQLATGHSDNGPASTLAATAGADPVVSGCNLSATMENAGNAYSASSCEIRGTGAGGSTDNDKGYYGTGQTWSATGYVSGAANKSQLRTHALSNGNVIWDFAGNVWEWTDAYINGAADRMAVTADAWQEWSAVSDYNMFNYTRPQNPSWSSTNGIGKLYVTAVAGQRGFFRGGSWDLGADDGVFALHLGGTPSVVSTGLGFRCSR